MAPRLPNLIWLRSFDAAARLLNFTKAAQELGLTQTAVSLHIKALEDTLGCQLFLRNPRHLALTDLGQAYVHSVRKALGDINLATVSLFGMPAKQTITMRAPISTVTLWLAPRLAVFMRSHPELRVRLVSTIWATSVADT
ncbi:MAG: LysR family transcriptional regulator, partial [Albidovulum sp.]